MALSAAALLGAGAFGPMGGTALAASASSPSSSSSPSATSVYAPSALTLTYGKGERAVDSAPQRAVTLSCAPTASGTHPDPAKACAQLRKASGNFDALPGRSAGACTRIYSPVVVTAVGVWQGKRVSYEHTYANPCLLTSGGMSVFSF